MKWFTPPTIGKGLFKKAIWEIPGTSRDIYLTFDDGPDPGVTEKILELLLEKGAKATFFCRGDKVEKYPELFQQIVQQGHGVGNHTYSHLNGWKTSTTDYLEDIEQADRIIRSKLFRPPYGKMTYAQYKKIRREYSIVMWSFMSYDFDKKLDVRKATDLMIRKIKPGSIIVFHDTEESGEVTLGLIENIINMKKSHNFTRLENL